MKNANLKADNSSSVAEASIPEEPGAVIPHAGIRAGRGWVTASSTATAGMR
jgi:hypothetical protein